MTDAVQVALIVSVPPTLAVIGATWLGWNKSKAIESRTENIEAKVDTVKTQSDGQFTKMLDMLMRVTASDSFNKGSQSEKDKASGVERASV